eukprot:11668031-Prorocentrum_lima.AAC.1
MEPWRRWIRWPWWLWSAASSPIAMSGRYEELVDVFHCPLALGWDVVSIVVKQEWEKFPVSVVVE